jgi:hypothetical protein
MVNYAPLLQAAVRSRVPREAVRQQTAEAAHKALLGRERLAPGGLVSALGFGQMLFRS